MKNLTEEEEDQLIKEIDHILESGANNIRLLEMFDRFLINRERKKIRKVLDNYKRTYKEGFTSVEKELILLKYFPNIDRQKFFDTLFGNTCPMVNGQIVTYPWDLEQALICGMEKRNQTEEEWD